VAQHREDPSGAPVPDARGVIAAGGDDARTIGREAGGVQLLRVPAEARDRHIEDEIPDPDRDLLGDDGEEAAVGAVDDLPDLVGGGHDEQQAAGARVEESRGVIETAGRHPLAVGRKTG
jgi:hypothetical protein